MSVPVPIRIQLSEITQNCSDIIVIDSNIYNSNLKWLTKACEALSRNKKIKKIIFKLALSDSKTQNFGKSLSKCFKNRESITIYGEGLLFFESPDWVKIWASTNIEALSIKDKLTGPSFINFCEGLKHNKAIKELTFRLLGLSECSELGLALKENTSVKVLNILCESRILDENPEHSIISEVASTSHSFQGFSHILSQNKSVHTYLLSGYLNICPYLILGLLSNRTVEKLVLENVDIDRESVNLWGEVFRHNSSIKKLEIKRGFNTISAMTLFVAMRQNKNISHLNLQECTFYEGGFMTLKDLLRVNQKIKKIEVKDMLQMAINTHDKSLSLNNFSHLISGLTDNTFIKEASISIYHNSSSAFPPVYLGENIQNLLHDLMVYNKSLIDLKIEGFRMGGSEICSVFFGLKSNSTLKSLTLTGNLIEWKDLKVIVKELKFNETVEFIDLSENKIVSFGEVKSTKDGSEKIADVKEFFEEIVFVKVKVLKIVNWLWETRNYPNELYTVITNAKSLVPTLI